MDIPEQNQRMQMVKNHFENEAREFDEIIMKIIPYYETIIETMVLGLPFNRFDRFDVIDLGCGTGTVALAIKKRFPNSRITCLDISENMLDMAKNKLKGYLDIRYVTGSFYDVEFCEKYDAVVSSLALHHLITDQDKEQFYRKMINGMKNGGVFINADVVLGSSINIQSLYLQKWIEFMNLHCSMEEIQNKWIIKHQTEDSPTSLATHFNLMAEAGFKEIDVLWKYYNFCVYTGKRLQAETTEL